MLEEFAPDESMTVEGTCRGISQPFAEWHGAENNEWVELLIYFAAELADSTTPTLEA